MSRISANVTFPIGKDFHADVVALHRAQTEQQYAEMAFPPRLLPSSASSKKGALLRLRHGSSSNRVLGGGMLLARHDHIYHAAAMQDCEGCADFL
jgi:hypothetical protein